MQISLEVRCLECRMEALVTREDPLREVLPVWIKEPSDGVRIRARPKRADV